MKYGCALNLSTGNSLLVGGADQRDTYSTERKLLMAETAPTVTVADNDWFDLKTGFIQRHGQSRERRGSAQSSQDVHKRKDG
jgi:hypothetical protein